MYSMFFIPAILMNMVITLMLEVPFQNFSKHFNSHFISFLDLFLSKLLRTFVLRKFFIITEYNLFLYCLLYFDKNLLQICQYFMAIESAS